MGTELLKFLSEIKLLLNKGCIIKDNELYISYNYLGKEYKVLKYKLSITNTLYFYNEDYEVIYVPKNKDDLWKFLIDMNLRQTHKL